MSMGAKVGSLNVDITLETARFKKGIQTAEAQMGAFQKGLGKIGGAIAGAFAVGAVIDGLGRLRDATKQALDAVGGLGEEAAQLGVTTKALQEFRFMATQVGLSNEEMDMGLAQLTRRLGDAAQGAKEPTEALERLGISIDQIKGKDAGEVLPLIAEGMSKIPDPTNRAAIAVDLFGKSGQKLMPLFEGGAAQIESFQKEMAKLGIVMSSKEIAAADKAADDLAKLNFVIEAQKNKKLVENAQAIIAYEKAVGDFKLFLITAVGDLENANQRYNKWALKFHETLAKGFVGPDEINMFVGRLKELGNKAVDAVAAMYRGVKTWITDKLNAVWEGAKSRIQAVGDKFQWLWDVTVGHSYIPDMVDAIGANMARLDAEMVRPVTAAVEAAAKKFQWLRDLMERLFPESRALIDFRATRDKLEAGIKAGGADGYTEDQLKEALRRLYLESFGVDRTSEVPLSDGVTEQGSLITGAFGEVSDALDAFGNKAGAVTVNVSKSFKDMADATVQALQNLAGSIKGGGFLDILSAVVGLGLQLGSIGAFGKGVAARLNGPKIPGYASGTNFHPGGLAIVGERGPELVDMARGARVIPNRDLAGIGGGSRVEIVPSKYFDVVVDGRIVQAAPVIIDGAARAGAARTAYGQRRRVG